MIRHLKDRKGFTLIELTILIAIFAISIMPIYRMLITSAKMQNLAEETYEATQHGQALLQEVQTQIETDITNEYINDRNITAVAKADWLKEDVQELSPSIIEFLNIDQKDANDKFHNKYKTDVFLYELHIWKLKDGVIEEPALSFVEYDQLVDIPDFDYSNTSDFIQIEIKDAIKKHFDYEDFVVWTNNSAKKPKAVAEISYKSKDAITIKAMGIDSSKINIEAMENYDLLDKKVNLKYKKHEEVVEETSITHELILEDKGQGKLLETDIIYMAVDLSTFKEPRSNLQTKVIRVENQTKATVVMPVFNEKDTKDIQIYPIQNDVGKLGNIIVEDRKKQNPSKNFIIGIIVKDAYNSNFGAPNKILSKTVDVYSYDYGERVPRKAVIK